MKSRIAVVLAALVFTFGPGMLVAQQISGGGGGGVCGSDTQVQFNNSGSCGASANFTWDNSAQRLNVVGNWPTPFITMNNSLWGFGQVGQEVRVIVSGNSAYSFDNVNGFVVSAPGTGAPAGGVIVFGQAGGTKIAGFSGPSAGLIEVNDGTATSGGGVYSDLKLAKLQAGILYSAAGTALPTCVAGFKGTEATVSDATGPTYGANYTSGGAVTVKVLCDGTNWKTY